MKKDNIEERASIELLKQYIGACYTPCGREADADTLSSADIVLAVREMCEVSVEEVSRIMKSAGFRVEFVSGRPYWKVFIV